MGREELMVEKLHLVKTQLLTLIIRQLLCDHLYYARGRSTWEILEWFSNTLLYCVIWCTLGPTWCFSFFPQNHHNTVSRSSPGPHSQAPLELLPRPKKRLSGASQGHCFQELNEMNMLSQVNMSGLHAATDENRQKAQRCIWVFLLSVCFAVMVAQITDRVRHFLSEPVSVQVTVARNNSLIYPAITICNKVRFVPFWSDWKMNTLSLQNMFNMTAMGLIRNFSEHSRHHHSRFKESSKKSDDIASLLGLPGIEDAHKLWNLTSHAKESMIKEVLCSTTIYAENKKGPSSSNRKKY